MVAQPPVSSTAPPSPLREFWSAFSENRGAVAGLALVLVITLLALFADVVALNGPLARISPEAVSR